MRVKIDRAKEPISPAEREHWLRGWYRVAEDDGSTVAYCPDLVTARVIAKTLEKRKRQRGGAENVRAD